MKRKLLCAVVLMGVGLASMSSFAFSTAPPHRYKSHAFAVSGHDVWVELLLDRHTVMESVHVPTMRNVMLGVDAAKNYGAQNAFTSAGTANKGLRVSQTWKPQGKANTVARRPVTSSI